MNEVFKMKYKLDQEQTLKIVKTRNTFVLQNKRRIYKVKPASLDFKHKRKFKQTTFSIMQ